MDKNLPEVTPQAVEVYKNRLAQVDFIKKQQWVVTSYAAAIYAAIVWVGRNADPISISLRGFLSFVIVVTGAYSIRLLYRFQLDLRDARISLDKASGYCFNDDQRKVLKLGEFEVEHPEGPFWHGWEVLLALILVCFVGAIVAVSALHSLKTAAV